MSKFKKKRGKGTPAISTASLPDIIFMLLFFFMVITTMRDSTEKIELTTPEATELNKLDEKSLVMYYLLGKPLPKFQQQYGTATRLQLNDQFAEFKDIPLFIEQKKLKTDERKWPFLVSSLKIDSKVTMGIVSDLKIKLRKLGQYRVNYSAKSRAGDL